MSSSRARLRAQPLRQQQQPVLHRSDSSPQSTVSGTLRGTSSSVRFEDTSRDRRSSKSAAVRAEQRSTVLQTAGGRPHELAETQRELERLRMQLRNSSEHEQQTEEYVSGLEATVEAQRHDNLLLRHHLANRQLLAEVLEEEYRDLVEAQQQMHLQQHPIACPQPLITHASTGTMTVASPENAFGDGIAQPSSLSAFCTQLPDRQSNFAGPSPPLSPTQSMPTSYNHVYGAAGGPHMHELPLHSPTVTALRDRWAQMQIAHEALPHGYADQQEALQRLPFLQQQRNNGANPTSIPIGGTTDNRFTSPPQHISVSEETLFSSSTTSSAPHSACTITDTAGTSQQAAATKHRPRSLGIRSRETEHAIPNALDTPNSVHQSLVRGHPHRDASPSAASEAGPLLEHRHCEELFADQQRCGHVALKALQDQIAEQEAEVADLRSRVTEQEAEVVALRQLLAEAQREAQAAGARQRDSGAAVQALRDQMAEQEAEVVALRQLLAEAQREAQTAGARQRDSGAAVQALRDQMAEQEAEVVALRQLLAEAQREAQAAGPRQCDSGAAVQALRDQMAEQEAEVVALRQLLAEAQREAQTAGARQRDSGAAVQALRDQMAEQEAEMVALRQLLAEAQREAQAAGPRQRDSGAAVQALRDQMAEQEAEMVALRQLLAEAQREAQAAGPRQRDSGAAVQALRDQMAEQEAEMVALRQLLAEAQREAQTAGARQRDSGAAVQALRDQMAEQEAEMVALRQLLAEAQREAQAAGPRQRDSGAAVQALRDQMAEQEAEMVALRQLLAEAQREAQAAGPRQRDSGAAVQALRDQMAEQEAEMVALRQLLAEAQREAQAAGPRQRDSGAAVQALRDQMAEQEAEMVALRQLLAEAQREAQAAGPRQRDSGAAVQALRDQMAEQEAEVVALRQLLAEAQREAQTAGARQRDSGAAVQALRDQMAEQEAEMVALRQLLAETQREAQAAGPRQRDSGAAVQALRDQMAEQEAEVVALRQLLAEAQREAQAAGPRQRDSGAAVQALRDQMAEQEAEVVALRQLLAEAQREAQAAGPRQCDSGAAVQALRDQMAEQEAEVVALRQLLAEAQREAQAAGARQRDSGAAVQALRDQMAEQEAEMVALRQLLAEAQREAQTAGARQRGGVIVKVPVGQEEGVRLAGGSAVVVQVDGGAGRRVVIDTLREGPEGKGDPLRWYRDRGSVEGAAADDERGVSSTGDDEDRKLAGAVDRGRILPETEELRSALAECREKLTLLEAELMAAKEAVEELRWYDERRDNCVEGKPLRQTYVRRSMEGEEWALVANACEEELIWRLRVDCSRACHVNVDCVRRVEYVLGSLHAEFCVEHNADVEGSELKDRVAEYPFPATWALFRRIVEGHTVPGPMQWAVPSRAEEKLLAEEALARILAQLEEACARQAFTSDWSEQRTELLRAAKLALAEVVAASRRECTDSLERLEELAALLLEARESERELRDRLFAAEEDMYELRRQHDDDRDGLVSAEAEARRSLDLYAARVAAQDEAMRVQVEQIVDLQEEVQALTSVLSDKNADLANAHAQAAALSRQVDETAAAYADTLEKLEKSVEMLDASRTNELVLSQTLYEAEYRCTQLHKAIEMDAAAHRFELVSATAERDRFKEGMEVFRELLPSLLAAAQPQPRKDSGDAGEGVDERSSTSALDAAFSGEGYAVAQGLREVLLHHLGCVEQLRRDKEGLADELDEAEKARGGYMAALEDALRSLVEERELRMRAHESQLQYSEQMMRELTMMRNAEEDEMVDDKADMEVNSNYGLPSTCSSSSPAV
ncbi:hypothetical protein CGC20_16195 [Leishmania donovani]|uniref:Flagellar attachment zone protein 1 conserved domain-containing protein n=1 Tax=Leishmania donovani TaxID=5661 RepID=A0A504Y900_LEIDO|nr:hypothetical protein CGC20_16195 [Leishmania donovani]